MSRWRTPTRPSAWLPALPSCGHVWRWPPPGSESSPAEHRHVDNRITFQPFFWFLIMTLIDIIDYSSARWPQSENQRRGEADFVSCPARAKWLRCYRAAGDVLHLLVCRLSVTVRTVATKFCAIASWHFFLSVCLSVCGRHGLPEQSRICQLCNSCLYVVSHQRRRWHLRASWRLWSFANIKMRCKLSKGEN